MASRDRIDGDEQAQGAEDALPNDGGTALLQKGLRRQSTMVKSQCGRAQSPHRSREQCRSYCHVERVHSEGGRKLHVLKSAMLEQTEMIPKTRTNCHKKDES